MGDDSKHGLPPACEAGRKKRFQRLAAGEFLTPLEERFAELFVATGNGTEAYRRASQDTIDPVATPLYNSARVRAAELKKRPRVAARIQELMDARAERLAISGDNVLLELARLAFANHQDLFDDAGRLIPIHLLPRDVAAAVTSIKVRSLTVPGAAPVEVEHVIDIKMADKGVNLERIGKHLRLFAPDLAAVGEQFTEIVRKIIG